MSLQNWWAKIWTIHDSFGEGKFLIPKNAQFWFEPVSIDGTPAFYYLRFESGTLHECLNNTKLYPVGVEELREETLPPWKENDEPLRKRFSDQALRVKGDGRSNPLARRLEGTFWAASTENEMKLEVLRFYIFSGLEDGRDWIVVDVMPPGEVTEEDGTGHGDG